MTAPSTSTPLRVLLIEDSEDDAALVVRELSRGGYDPTWERVDTAAALAAALRRQPWDLITCDWMMPQLTAPAALQLIQESGYDVPIIIVSGEVGEEVAVTAMKTGAHDFVSKHRMTRLVPAIERELREADGRRARKRAEHALRESEASVRSVLSALSAHIAVLDRDGTITAVNQAWLRFAAANGDPDGARTGVGINYLDTCRRVRGTCPEAAQVLRGIEAVMEGSVREFTLEYPCHGPDEQRWFVLSATSLQTARGGAVVSHVAITSRKRAEAALTAMAAKYRDLVETAHDLIWSVDTTGRFIFINQAVEPMLGYTPAEVLGRPFTDFLDAAEGERVVDVFREILTGVRRFGIEIEVRHRDGRTVGALVNALPVFGGQGRVVGVTGTTTDVTDRKRAERELLRRVEFERLIATVSTNFINLASNEIDAGIAHALQMIGAATGTDSAYIARFSADGTMWTLTHKWSAGGWPALSETFEQRPAALLPWVMEHLRRREVVHVPDVAGLPAEAAADRDLLVQWGARSVLAVPMVSAGRLAGLLGFAAMREQHWPDDSIALLRMVAEMFTNALDRQQAEQERLRLEAAVQQAAEGVIISDPHGRMLYANPAAERITGCTRDELNTQLPDILLQQEPDRVALQQMIATLSRRQVWQGLWVRRCRDGSRCEIDVTVSPVLDAGGHVVAYVGIGRDVTHERQVEAQLRQSQKLEALGRLAGGVAHDFNNQLTIIKGCAQFLLNGFPPDSPSRRDIERIEETVNRGARLVRQLLTFSRLEPLDTQPLNLNDLLNDMSPMLRLLLGEQVTMQLRPTSVLWPIRADRAQLEQVVMNLVINARDAMTPGGVATAAHTIALETANVTLSESLPSAVEDITPGPYVMLAAADNGPGMSPEVQAHIFEPFFTTKEGGGTGLGLATVFGIVKQHGGYIACDSEPGHGTRFRLYFPRDQGAAPAATLEGPSERRRLPDAAGRTILVVEDEANVRNVLVRALQESGYQVHSAADAAAALRTAEQLGAIDLLVTDIVLPQGSGHLLARRLMPARGNARTLFISGYYTEALDLSEFPGSRFLQKPFGLDELLRVVDDMLRE